MSNAHVEVGDLILPVRRVDLHRGEIRVTADVPRGVDLNGYRHLPYTVVGDDGEIIVRVDRLSDVGLARGRTVLLRLRFAGKNAALVRESAHA